MNRYSARTPRTGGIIYPPRVRPRTDLGLLGHVRGETRLFATVAIPRPLRDSALWTSRELLRGLNRMGRP